MTTPRPGPSATPLPALSSWHTLSPSTFQVGGEPQGVAPT
jgi:hypothetical protein